MDAVIKKAFSVLQRTLDRQEAFWRQPPLYRELLPLWPDVVVAVPVAGTMVMLKGCDAFPCHSRLVVARVDVRAEMEGSCGLWNLCCGCDACGSIAART